MLVIRLSFCDKLLIPYIEFFCSSCLLSPSTCIHKDLEPVSWLPKGFSSVGAFESKLIFFNSFSMWLSSSVFSKIVALSSEISLFFSDKSLFFKSFILEISSEYDEIWMFSLSTSWNNEKKTAVSKLEAKNEDLEEKLDSYSTKIDELEAENVSLINQIELKDSLIRNHQLEQEKQEINLKDLNKTINKLKDENKTLSEIKEKLENTVKDLNSKISESKSQIEDCNQQILELKTQIKDLEKQKEEALSKFFSSEKALKDLQEIHKSLEDQNTALIDQQELYEKNKKKTLENEYFEQDFELS